MAKKFKEHEVDISRLCMSMQRARLSLRRYREERREAVRQYVGRHWSDEGAREKVPVNLISLYTNIVGRNLIAKNPRVMLSTSQKNNKAAVSAMQSWCNQEMEQMGIVTVLQRIVLDALFSVGIAKVALATAADAAVASWNIKAGTPFCELVDLDDFVFDVHARDFSRASYMGHRYRVPLEVIKDDKEYSRTRKDLQASNDTPYNVEGDERIGLLGRGFYSVDSEEFEDFVDLWEVYIPRKRLVLTLADDQLTGAAGSGTGRIQEPLREQEWLGPDSGPYHMLAYGTVPGNAMPKGAIQDLIDLHETVNRSYRKLDRQAGRQKEILAVMGGATEDGSRIMDANDGDIVRVDNPEKSKPMSFGAPNQVNMAYAIHMKDLFAYMAGNLDMMGGLSPQAKTLGQDRMLAENASKAIADMQDTTINFTSSVCRALCWYWWHDPFKTMKTVHSLPGMPEMEILRKVTPQQRQQAKWIDLDIKVDPYSMQHQTPAGRVQALNQVVMQIIMPMMPVLQQQGVMFDVNAYLTKLASYMDMPDLGDIITIQDAPQPQQASGQGGGAAEAPGMPQNTQRNYVRESMPGRTEKGNNMTLMNSLMGVDGGGTHDTNGTTG